MSINNTAFQGRPFTSRPREEKTYSDSEGMMTETNIYGDVRTDGGLFNTGTIHIHNRGYPRFNYDVQDILDFYDRAFVGQKETIQRVADFAAQQEPGYLLIEAPAGHGKSALLAHLIAQHQRGTWVHAVRPTLLYFFIRQSYYQHTAIRFLQAINAQMLNQLRIEGGVPADLDDLRAQFSELWKGTVTKASKEQPLLVLIDGLDESSETDDITIAATLPALLADYVHIVVTSRPNPEPQQQVGSTHPFRWANRLSLHTLRVEEVGALLRKYGLISENGDKIALRIHGVTKGVPLFARFVCQDVVEKGENILTSLEADPPEDVKAYFREQFRLLEQKAESDLTWQILGLLTQCAGSIASVEIADLLEQPSHRIRKALQPIQRYLLGQERFELMHIELRQILLKETHHKEVDVYQKQLLAWGDRYKAARWPPITPEYLMRHYGQHLVRAKRQADLYKLISEAWMQAHVQVLGSYNTFLKEVDRVWDVAHESGRAKGNQKQLSQGIAMQVKCLLAYSSVASLSNRLPPSLTIALLNDGLWTKPQAYAYIKHITEHKQAADTRLALLQHQNAHHLFSSREIKFIVSQVLEDLLLMERTTSAIVRSYQLFQLLPHLATPDHFSKSVDLAKSFPHSVWRPRLLAHLAGQVTDPVEQVELIELLIESCKQLDYNVYNDDYPHVIYIYRDIVHKVPMDKLSQVCHRLVEQAQANPTADDKEMRLLGLFFEHLAWHMSDAKAEAFITLLLSANYSLSGVAITIARLAYRLSDQSALNMAIQLEIALKRSTSSRMLWVISEASMAFLALAYHRTDNDCKNRLLTLAETWLRQIDNLQYPFGADDLYVLWMFISGQRKDEELSRMIKEGKLLTNFWRRFSEHNAWRVALLPYLGIQTIKALFARAIRDEEDHNGHGVLELGASLYIIPLIAAKLPPEELSLIYRLGAGRHESFACTGYVHAAIQNYQRMPAAVKDDTIAWRIDSWTADVNNELLLLIAKDLRKTHFKDDDYGRKRRLFAAIAPTLSKNQEELLLSAFTDADLSRYGSELDDKETLVKIAQHLPQEERLPHLEKFMKDAFRIIDTGEQKQLLTALRSARPQKDSNNPLQKLIQAPIRYLLSRSKLATTQQEAGRWELLRATINKINQMPTREQRIAAFNEVASLLGDIIFTIGNPAYKDYAQNAQEIWSALNPRYVEDALSVIDGNHDSVQSHDYVRAFMPAVALLRPDLLPELEKHILAPYSQLKAIQYANLALFFSGEQQLALLQKSVSAFDFAEFPEYIVPRILNEIAGYADDTLIPHLLQWLARYPVATALGKLAKKVAANQEYLTQCLAIAQDIEESIHEFVTNLAPLVTVDWLRRLLLLLIERQNREEQSRSYPALAQAWLTQLANQATYEEAYNLWYNLCSALKKYPRDYTMNQLSYFVDIVAYLGGKQATNACAAAIQDIYTWWEVEWREPRRIAQIT